MQINVDTIKKIDLCYENCEVDTIYYHNLLGINIQRKTKSCHTYQDKASYNIKTFEIALHDDNHVLKDMQIMLRTDLAQFTIHYLNGSFDHFFIVWGKKDCLWDHSSLQKVHHKDNIMTLTSNCESIFLNHHLEGTLL